jgi:tRNA threonylcarbamoyladenosine biosynthesis protein TsaB
MTVLALETATSVCGVAVVRNGEVLAHRSLNGRHIHAEKIMTLVDEALRAAGREIGGLEGIAVSAGPGSFTGLRIGVSTAKGLAFGRDLPVTGVSTLEALAQNVAVAIDPAERGCFFPVVKARQNEVYAALYLLREGKLTCTMQPRIIATAGIAALAGAIDGEGPGVHIVGDAAEEAFEILSASATGRSGRFVLAPSDLRFCDARSVGRLGELRLQEGRGIDARQLEPVYLHELYVTTTSQLPVS